MEFRGGGVGAARDEENEKKSREGEGTWGRIRGRHVREGEGRGVEKQIISVNNWLHQFTTMRQNAAVESITEHYQRRDRAKKALSTSGFDIDKLWLDSEEKRVVHFLHSLDPSRYGGLIRDVSNGVVAIPGSMTDLLTMARDRKEIAFGSNSIMEPLIINGAFLPGIKAVHITISIFFKVSANKSSCFFLNFSEASFA